ncbi:hypothetical protein C5167_029950 [Papaver somniferum]|nr:hypothetical protein C5167_029950 [Papaver somniferum]
MVRKLQNPAENRASLPLVEQGFSDGSSRDAGNGGDCNDKLSSVKYGASFLKAQVEDRSNKDQKFDNKLKRHNDSE